MASQSSALQRRLAKESLEGGALRRHHIQPPVSPQAVQAATAGGPYGPNFKDRLRQFSANFQLSWRQALRPEVFEPFYNAPTGGVPATTTSTVFENTPS